MWILHILTFIYILQHRSSKYFVASVPFISILFNKFYYDSIISEIYIVHVFVHGTLHC